MDGIVHIVLIKLLSSKHTQLPFLLVEKSICMVDTYSIESYFFCKDIGNSDAFLLNVIRYALLSEPIDPVSQP